MFTNLYPFLSFFFFCMRNYQELNSLKQHLLVSLPFCMSEVWQSKVGFSANSITRLISSFQLDYVLIRRPWGKSSLPSLIVFVGRIWCLAVIWLRSPFLASHHPLVHLSSFPHGLHRRSQYGCTLSRLSMEYHFDFLFCNWLKINIY